MSEDDLLGMIEMARRQEDLVEICSSAYDRVTSGAKYEPLYSLHSLDLLAILKDAYTYRRIVQSFTGATTSAWMP